MIITDKESFALGASIIDKAPLLSVLSPRPCQREYNEGVHILLPDIIAKNTHISEFSTFLICDTVLREHIYLNKDNLNLRSDEIDQPITHFETVLPTYCKQGETWSIAFSPNHSYMAWSAGMKKVYLIRIFAFTDQSLSAISLFDNQKNTTDFQSLNEPIKQKTTISLDCGHIVWSMAFGSAQHLSSRLAHHLPIHQHGTKNNPNPRKLIVNKRFHFEMEELIFATGLGNGQIKIWQIPSGQLLTILFDHTEPIHSLQFAPDCSLRLLSGSADRTLKVWDMVDDGNMTISINVSYQTRVKAIAWSPSAALVVSVGGSNKKVNGIGTHYKVMAKMTRFLTIATSCILLRHNLFIIEAQFDMTAFNRQEHAYVWDIKAKLLVGKLIGHLHEVVDCDFSPDGALVVTASYDTYAILWDPYTGMAIRKFGHLFPPPRPIFASGPNNHYVKGVSFSPDGRHFVTVADDGYMRIWDMCRHIETPCKIGWTDYPLCCKFSTRSTHLASGDKYGRLLLWHFKNNCNIRNDCSCCYTPNRLDHLCRSVIRTIVPDTNLLDPTFNEILPKKLIHYIKYLALGKDGKDGSCTLDYDGTLK